MEVAYPGRKLGGIEEFIPGDGVLVSDGDLVAAVPGIVERDMEERVIKVRPIKKPLSVKVDDELIGRIIDLAGVFGVVKIEVLNGEMLDRELTGVVYPTRKVALSDLPYKPGDVILARVVSLANRLIHLSIAGGRYGVIKAYCSSCGALLEPRVKGKEGPLVCRSCGTRERRKVSEWYGNLERLIRA